MEVVREFKMRMFFMITFLLSQCILSDMSFADEKSDCLNNCAKDKLANDMVCPPAGGVTDKGHEQCVDKNTYDYNSCIKACSPPEFSPVTQPDNQPQMQLSVPFHATLSRMVSYLGRGVSPV